MTELLRSSERSWVSDSRNLVPDFRAHPDLGFAQGAEQAARLLAVMMEGRFDSAFKGKDSPLLEARQETDDGGEETGTPAGAEGGQSKDETEADPTGSAEISGVIERSPESARLILVGSSTLFTDQAEGLVGQALGTRYTKAAEFAQNLVDWSLEDQGLLGIRSRGRFARTLVPLGRDTQALWEYLNYGFAVAGLALVWSINRRRRRLAESRYALILQEA